MEDQPEMPTVPVDGVEDVLAYGLVDDDPGGKFAIARDGAYPAKFHVSVAAVVPGPEPPPATTTVKYGRTRPEPLGFGATKPSASSGPGARDQPLRQLAAKNLDRGMHQDAPRA